MEEEGKIVQTVFNPGQSFSSTGITTKGSLHFSSGETDDSYAVVVECKHGTFVLKRKEVFEQVHQGDKVTLRYTELRTDDGALVRYNFIGLQVKERKSS